MQREQTIRLNLTEQCHTEDRSKWESTGIARWGRLGTVLAQCTVLNDGPPRKSLRQRHFGHQLVTNRRGRDSNPRCSYPQTAFRMRLLQPLGHLSRAVRILAKIRGALKAGAGRSIGQSGIRGCGELPYIGHDPGIGACR